MLLRFRFAQLPWAVLLACGLLVLGADPAKAEKALASWYGPGYYGLPTASGEPYDAYGLSASHETLPLGTEMVVSYGGNSVLVTVNDRGAFAGERELGLSQGAAQELGLTWAGVDYVEVSYPGGEGYGAGYPSYPEGLTGPAVNSQGNAQNGAGNALLEVGYVGDIGYGVDHPSYSRDSNVGALADTNINIQNGVNGGALGASNGATRDLDLVTTGQHGANNEAHVVQQYPIDPAFIGRQEGFRLDGYVPDLGASMSGVTIGTGVDIGQMSVAGIQSLDLPNELKQRLIPYAGLTQHNAVYLLSNLPLYLTVDEAHALDRAVTQNIIGGVATRYDLAAPGRSFAELPLEARTVIADVAYQYGPNLEQRAPAFWSDVTQGNWDGATQKLRAFGDRYPTRRNAEADLLELSIDRGDLGSYVVQPGETLAQVAPRLGASVEYLAMRNGITDPDVMYGGQPLYY